MQLSRALMTGVVVVVVLVMYGPAQGVHAQISQPAHGLPWWRSPAIQSQMSLSSDQVRRIDSIYRRSLPNRRRLQRRLATLQGRLTRMLTDGPFDNGHAQTVVDRFFSVQKQSNVARTLMLVKIYQQLSPDQRTVLADVSRNRSDAHSRVTAQR